MCLNGSQVTSWPLGQLSSVSRLEICLFLFGFVHPKELQAKQGSQSSCGWITLKVGSRKQTAKLVMRKMSFQYK